MSGIRPLTVVLAVVATLSLSGSGASRDRAGPAAALTPLGAAVRVEAVRGFFRRSSVGLTAHEIAAVAPVLVRQAQERGLEWQLVLAVIEVESGGDNFARSGAGALGLMQLLPATGEAVAERIGVPWRGPTTLFDPEANVRLGIAYLAELVERYGDVSLALAAYNWGPTRIAARLRRGEPVPVVYVRRVLAAYRASPGRRGI